jgi:type II secretory pathway component GspD/PulD (secretin)
MPRASQFKSFVLAALIAAGWISSAIPTVDAQRPGGGRGQRPGGGGNGFRFDPAQMEQFRQRMEAAQKEGAAKSEDDKKAEGDKSAEATKPEATKPFPGDDLPAPVQRPVRPRRDADPSELDVGPDEAGKLSFSFKGQPWPAVLEWLADVSRMSLQWEEAPAGYLDLTTRGKYTVEEVRDLLNSVLLAKGFTLLRNGEVLIVANLKKLDPGLVPRMRVDDLDECGTYEPVKVFFDLDSLVAEVAVEEMRPLLSPWGKATALKATNRLDVLDTAGNLRRVRELLAEEQSGNGQQRLIREFKLRYTRAVEVVETLNALLGIEGKKGDASQVQQVDPRQMWQVMQMAGGPQGRGQGGGGDGGQAQAPRKESAPIYLAVNTRENSILANAPPDKMADIKQAIEAIDVAQDRNQSVWGNVQRMQVYRLAGVSPESLVKVLKDLGGLDPTTKLEVDAKNRALIAYAPLVDHVTIRALVEKIDGTARKFEVIQLRTLSAEYVAGSIITLMQGPEKTDSNANQRFRFFPFDNGNQNQNENADKFWVEADIERNRLLLRANDVELAEVKALLMKLGEIPSDDRGNRTRRLVPGTPGEETADFLKRLEKVWQRVSPNPLEIEIDEGSSAETATKPRSRRRGAPLRPDTSGSPRAKPSKGRAVDTPGAEPSPDRSTDTRGDRRRDPRYRLAQERSVSPPADEDDANEIEGDEEEGDESEGDESKGDATEQDADKGEASEPDVEGMTDDDDQPADEASSYEDSSDDGSYDERPAEMTRPGERGDRRPADDRPLPPEARAPVKITVEPDGIVISSSDVDALDRLEDLMGRLMPTRMTYKVFPLEYIDSLDMVLLLRDFFREQSTSSSSSDSGTGRSSAAPSRATLGKRKALSFVSDSRTNTILVQGADAAQLEEIESLIEFYDIPEPPNSESVRRTKRVPLRYAKAKEMADVVKDVYRDLLSPNDRALAGGGAPQQQQQRPQGDGYASTSSSSYPMADTSRSGLVPRFKGLLSVGVDERTNGLVLSAPQGVLNEIVSMVKELDAAARSTRQVITLLRVKGAGTAALVQQAVAPKKEQGVQGQQPAAAGASAPAQQPPGQGGGNPGGGQPGGLQIQAQDASSGGGSGNGQGGFGGGQRGQGAGANGRQRGGRGQ